MRQRILVFVSIIGVIILFGLVLSNRVNKNESPSSNAPIEDQPIFEPISSNEGGVEVIVNPINLSSNSPIWSFGVSLSTHSVELSKDLVSVSKLIFDTGETITPLSWEGDPPGGHHRSGILTFSVLTFSKPSPATSKVTLKILEIGGVSEREFKWNIK